VKNANARQRHHVDVGPTQTGRGRTRPVVAHAVPGVFEVDPRGMLLIENNGGDVHLTMRELKRHPMAEWIVAKAAEPRGAMSEGGDVRGDVGFCTTRVESELVCVGQASSVKRRDHRHRLPHREQRGRRARASARAGISTPSSSRGHVVVAVGHRGDHFSSATGAASMSSNAWFSPAIAQMNEYAAVPTPECNDQLGEMMAWRSETTR